MPGIHHTYHIREGETLKSIATALNSTVKELMNFHNTYCPAKEVIENELPKGLKKLILHPAIQVPGTQDANKGTTRKIKFAPGFRLPFEPYKTPVAYGYLLTLQSGGKENTLKYNSTVTFISKEAGSYIFEIHRSSKIFINDVQASDIADELAAEVAKVLYPLQVRVSETGKWLEVYNYNDIHRRWNGVKAGMHSRYAGETLEAYLALCEQTMNDKNLLNKAMAGDFFIRSLFNGIHVSYTHRLGFVTHISFPLLNNVAELRYKVIQKTARFLDEYGLIQVEQRGILDDERAKADLENGSALPFFSLTQKEAPKAGGICRAHYFLKPGSFMIESLHLECSVALETPKGIKITIAQINQQEHYNHQ